MTATHALYDAYCDGSVLTDEQVLAGEKHFHALANLLYISGPPFIIAAKESQRIYLGFCGIRVARELKEPK